MEILKLFESKGFPSVTRNFTPSTIWVLAMNPSGINFWISSFFMNEEDVAVFPQLKTHDPVSKEGTTVLLGTIFTDNEVAPEIKDEILFATVGEKESSNWITNNGEV